MPAVADAAIVGRGQRMRCRMAWAETAGSRGIRGERQAVGKSARWSCTVYRRPDCRSLVAMSKGGCGHTCTYTPTAVREVEAGGSLALAGCQPSSRFCARPCLKRIR